MTVRAVDEARTLFAGAGLPFPPVPDALAPQLRRRSAWWFTTRGDDAPPPYFLDESVRQFVSGEAGDGVVLAHAGHGVGSWAIHCYVTLGGFGIFVQSAWGGAGADDEQDRHEKARMAARFEKVGQVLGDGVAARVPAADAARCAVVATDFGSSRWARFAPGTAPAWHQAADPFAEVLAARR